MPGVRSAALQARAAMRRARFELWIAELRAQLRLHGMRLVLDAPHGLAFVTPPHLRVARGAVPGSTFTLRIGPGVKFGRDVELEIVGQGDSLLELDEYAFVMNRAEITLRGGTLRMGPHASIRTGSLVKSEGELTMGTYAGVSNYAVVHCAERITFEDYAGTADRVTIVDSEKALDGSDTYFLEQPLVTGPVHLGRNAFLASNVVVTAGTRVGANAVVAANAVLTGKEYPGGWIIGGIPAKPLRALPRTEVAETRAE